ncbi:MAG: glycosyl hydrolase 53 family protein [Saprospiraceae bacterium]|nr:glycosyl hydrolase 53 family protein [Saprospiraceae bacterium]
MRFLFLLLILISFGMANGQPLYLGADLSYVNEMEDCGVKYKENQVQKDVYKIFADRGCNLVRLRLWHTPKWHDNLNAGKRYSDFADVKKSIRRAKENNMKVLLNFHLSDNWADPQKQLVPDAWLAVVNNLPILKDSLYNYIYKTLSDLNKEELLPEMLQIGNETNKGIMLSPADNAQWNLNWNRNSQLFNTAIKAVRDVERETGKKIEIALHLAAPEELKWLLDGFLNNGVVDFDIIGMSYYWAWHKPTTIAKTGEVIKSLKQKHPDKQIMIFETGYIWTTASNDPAPNIISEVHPSYSPASPSSQLNWLVDLTEEVVKNGGNGVLYWEPAWVSSPCFTQWGKGSHQEHAAFFDFNNNLMNNAGIGWLGRNYVSSTIQNPESTFTTVVQKDQILIKTELIQTSNDSVQYHIFNLSGQEIKSGLLNNVRAGEDQFIVDISNISSGWYVMILGSKTDILTSYRFVR